MFNKALFLPGLVGALMAQGNNNSVEKVSVHGGHSGQFCHHARDSLEAIIREYIDQGFSWVGITEHMAPASDAFRYPDEKEDDISAEFLLDRFRTYFAECRRLKEKFRKRIDIYTAFETESYDGAFDFVEKLAEEFRPDYLVGSVHHVAGLCIDFDEPQFKQAVAQAGGMKELYLQYFDDQFAMLEALEPAVVGHFDLVRKFDPDYLDTLKDEEIWERVTRNLDFISDHELILDFNLRGFDKATEQYPAMPVLEAALDLDIAVVPGDDSHGVETVGRHYEQGIEVLKSLGASTDWPKPALLEY